MKAAAVTMVVRELMTSPAITVHQDDEVSHAVEVLDRMNVTSLPVVDDVGRIVGLVGEADLIRRIVGSDPTAVPRPAQPSLRGATRVGDVMTRHVPTVRADDEIGAALALMSGLRAKSLPVVLHGHVAGMLSRRDIIRALARGDLADDGSVRAPA
jgi:CBS-domain-containing membrane protein